jgi:uncharacterized membrane protein YjfL (UPF0719 family)
MFLRTLVLTSYELVLALAFGLLSVLVTVRIAKAAVLRTDIEAELGKGNVAVGILTGTLVVCVLILLQAGILPSAGALQAMVLGAERVTVRMVAVAFGYFVAFYAISLVLGTGMILLSIRAYMSATRRLDEVKEIRGGNVAVALTLSLVLLGVTVFIQPSVSRFLSSLVNWDSLPALAGVQDAGTRAAPAVTPDR